MRVTSWRNRNRDRNWDWSRKYVTHDSKYENLCMVVSSVFSRGMDHTLRAFVYPMDCIDIESLGVPLDLHIWQGTGTYCVPMEYVDHPMGTYIFCLSVLAFVVLGILHLLRVRAQSQTWCLARINPCCIIHRHGGTFMGTCTRHSSILVSTFNGSRARTFVEKKTVLSSINI